MEGGLNDQHIKTDGLSDRRTRTGKIEKIEFKSLPDYIQLALQEAFYYAAETGRLKSVIQLWESGGVRLWTWSRHSVIRNYLCDYESFKLVECSVPDLPWNVYTWSRALEFASEYDERKFANRLLTNFWPLMVSKLDAEIVEYCISVLFSHLNWECRYDDGNSSTVAFVISSLWNHFKKESIPDDTVVPLSTSHHKLIVDKSFVNNKELSDIRFMVDGEIVYAHRIMLFTVSERFKELLRSPNGTVDITDVSHSTFLVIT
ncbi:Ankyrin repeat and BTB/POZ domain-containing protein 2 [Parelaphostrongylus tenuis]|uniref:Ankyrin repeat and BTB/POZ domain-containing protein 2 n=1 Tax=Parelaphostrongylus tenuis TaxID=148309 RepID=A0AAD5M4D9_PARTN|nr:Ankyrin repeat and BTB/POZ domain-containing protein 2 [Parelaphostrongylus tenuis]